MTSVALGLLLAFAPIADADWRTYEDPTGTFSLELPASWVAEAPDDMGFAQIVGFKLPHEATAFTISITPDLRLPEELPLSLLELYFPPQARLGEARREKGAGWNSVRQEASADTGGGPRTWLGAFYSVGSTMFAITLSDGSAQIEARRPTFERIVSSIRFKSPRSTGKDLSA
jgi:hypothetical protein